MSHHAGGELDAIPHQHIRGHELREARQRPASQLGHRTGSKQRPGEPARRAHVGVREPGHDLTSHDTPALCPGARPWARITAVLRRKPLSARWSRTTAPVETGVRSLLALWIRRQSNFQEVLLSAW